jgi:nucleotide-binding universal stress UspA family protein
MNQHAIVPELHGVVVGVDGSDSSLRAARWAAAEALRRDAPLALIHALGLSAGKARLSLGESAEVDRQRAAGSSLLRLASESLRAEFPELTVGAELSDEDAIPALATLAERSELLVTGTRGHGGFAGMLLGSVSRGLAVHANCPLTVVREEARHSELDEVVLGVGDGPDDSQAATAYAFEAAKRYDARLHAVRAWPAFATRLRPGERDEYSKALGDQEQAVEQRLEPLRASFPDVDVEISAGRGNPVPILNEAARGTHLLVVAAHKHRSGHPAGAGYVVEGLLAHSPTPVAVVPAL